MTDRVIRVRLDPAGVTPGADAIRGSLTRIDRSTAATQRTLRGLTRVATALVSALSVREIIRYGDAWQQAQNRIRLVTDSTEELAAVQAEIAQLAIDTRSSLDSTVELYSRVARATDGLGISQQQVLDLTETVNQSLQISGATAAEAAGSTIQFAQALGSGELRGQELRSVLEQNTRLSQALAREFGVNVGELLRLGEAGELTTERILEALANAGTRIQGEFDQINPTVGSAFTQLNAAVGSLIGQVDDASGATSSLAGVISGVARDIQTDVIPAFLQWAESAGLVEDALSRLSLEQLRVELEQEQEALERLVLDRLGPLGERGGQLSQEAVDALAEGTRERIILLEEEIAARERLLNDAGDGGNDTLSRQQQAAADELAEIREELALQAQALDVAASGVLTYEEALRRLEIQSIATTEGQALEAAEIIRITEANESRIEAQERVNDLQSRGADLTQSLLTPLEVYRNELDQINELLAANAITQETANRATQEAEDRLNGVSDALERGRALTEALRTPLEVYRDELLEINELLTENAINEDTAQRARERAGREFAEELCESAEEVEDCNSEAAERSAEAWGTFTERALRAATDWESGTVAAITSVIEELLKLQDTGDDAGGFLSGLFSTIGSVFGFGRTSPVASSTSGALPVPGQVFARQGADFTVPPGFPNDDFRVNVSSGERVQVTPAGQRAPASSFSMVNNISVVESDNAQATAGAISAQLEARIFRRLQQNGLVVQTPS